MDKYDCEQTDKEIGRRLDLIFKDPKRHKFISEFEALDPVDGYPQYGPRGGKILGKKSICFYCGKKSKGHAALTEEL